MAEEMRPMGATPAVPGSSLDLVNGKRSVFGALWDRMDKDKDLVYLKSYVLKSSDNVDIPRVVSVTMNDPAVFVNAVASGLSGASMQTVVEGLEDSQNGVVERFLEANYAQADERLLRRRIPSLFAWLCNHICIRGFIGARWICRQEGDKYVPDCLPTDMRYCVYEFGSEDLNWWAPTYRRSVDVLRREYPDVAISGDDDLEIIDFWDGEKNERWIDGTLAKSEKHSFGRVPAIIIAAGTGFMLQDLGYLEHDGESILMLDRDLYAEQNRIASIEQTMNMKLVLPPYQKLTSTPGQGPPPPYPDKPGTVSEVGLTEEYKLLQQADLNNSSRMAHADIMSAIQRGSLSNVDYGNLSFPLSAVAISDITEIRNKILVPRLQALAEFYQQLSRMMIEQYRQNGYAFPIGRAGKRTTFNAADLPEPDAYTISYRFLTKSRRQEIANLAMAVSAKGTFSRETILRDIAMLQNPDEEIARLDAEEVEALDPAIKLYRKASSLLVKAEEVSEDEEGRYRIEAEMLCNRAVEIIKQQKMAAATPPTPPKAPTPGAELPSPAQVSTAPLVPLMGQATTSGPRPGAGGPDEGQQV